MSIDQATVRRIAHLARISVEDSELAHLGGEINAILHFVETLSTLNVDEVEAMTSACPMTMPKRRDIVSDGFIAEQIVANAPEREDAFFVVPKVVE